MVNDPDEEATEYGGHPILQLWMNDPKEETTFFFRIYRHHALGFLDSLIAMYSLRWLQ